MWRLLRWLGRALRGLLVMFLVLTLLGTGTVYGLLRLTLPTLDGELAVPSLRGPVTVYRDAYGVPHIYAEHEWDLFLAAGYVQAQDRLWQMDLTRRAAAGRLSEIFGVDLVEADHLLRAVGLYRAAAATLSFLDPDSQAALDAFTAGVNAYIEQAGRRLPPEFHLLRYRPDPWSAADSLAIGKYMAWYLGGNWSEELLHTAFLNRLNEDLAVDLMPGPRPDSPVIVAAAGGRPRVAAGGSERPRPGAGAAVAALGLLATLMPGDALLKEAGLPGLLPGGRDLGSNNWVVAGGHTDSGYPLLANDPHLGLGTPSIWYQMHLSGGRYQVVGVTFPGVPGVVVGHNQRIAWGVTNTGPDVQDLYLEEPHPDDPTRFLYNSEYYQAEVLQEEIRVRGQDHPEVREVILTRHGPVITAVAAVGAGEALTPDTALSMRWTAHDPGGELQAVLAINRASNWPDFRDALRFWVAPMQNFVFADVEGDIAYKAAGRVPIRKRGDGLTPVPGWTDEYEWAGYIRFEDLPELVNPPRGVIWTANNQVAPDSYRYYISASWAPPYRAQRIGEALLGQDRDGAAFAGPGTVLPGLGLTGADMGTLQVDWRNLHARRLFSALAPGIDLAVSPGQAQPGTANRIAATGAGAAVLRDAAEALQQWAGGDEPPEDRPDSVGAYLFHALYQRLLVNTLEPHLGEDLLAAMLQVRQPVNPFDHLILERADSVWFQPPGDPSPGAGSLDSAVAVAFAQVVADTAAVWGPQVDRWTWGRVHRVVFSHPLGQIDLLDRILSPGPFPWGGSHNTVGHAGYEWTRPYTVTTAAPWRQVVDLSDMGAGRNVMVPGQSGHRLSRHYADQVDLWLAGRYQRQWFDLEDVQGAAVATLLLRPSER